MQVAIDGPASSGKSTISKIIASKYSLTYIDTGAMYRAAAWLRYHYGVTGDELIDILKNAQFELKDNGTVIILNYKINGTDHREDITQAIRTPEVTALVGEVSADKAVRSILTVKQREIASGQDVIMDGRDIGTVVLPDADLKFFMTATAEARAKRRTEEWTKKGHKVDYETVLADIIKRDELDASRDTAPLKKAKNAILLDTTHLTIDEVTAIIGAAVMKIQ